MGEDCLLHPEMGLNTLKPDAASLQRSEVHYGWHSELWMASLESAPLIHQQVKACSELFSKRAKKNRAEVRGSRERAEQAASVNVYIVWKANWTTVTYLRDGDDSWPGVWRRALCVETTVTSPSAQNNLPARAGLSVVCLHWDLFQTSHAHANVHSTLHTLGKCASRTENTDLRGKLWADFIPSVCVCVCVCVCASKPPEISKLSGTESWLQSSSINSHIMWTAAWPNAECVRSIISWIYDP